MIDRDEWFRRGCALHAARRWMAAAACFARARGSDDPATEGRTLVNYGWNLHLTGRHHEAADLLARAAAKMPEEGAPCALLAQVCLTLGDDELALSWARDGVKKQPDAPINHTSLAFALFFNDQWREGWQQYEWRYRYRPDLFPPRSVPLWRGEKVTALWVECEMGLGDTIFGLRWLNEAARLADEIVLHVQPELRTWIEGLVNNAILPQNISVLPIPRTPPTDVQAWCPILSVPAAMTGQGKPVLAIERPQVVAPAKIGICWFGNPAHEAAHHRDCPLPYWLRLAENADIELHSLQVGGSQQLIDLGAGDLIQDRAPEITNFADTAEIVSEMDLIISVDTAVAHLAGTLGVPTWLLLNQRGQDFRWGRGNVTPWYPSMVIWRRELQDGWDGMMDNIDDALLR